MKYFWVYVKESYIPPEPNNWYGIIDKKTLDKNKFFQMPKHLIFRVKRHMQMIYTDIITFPCFMVSGMVRNVINKYDASIYFYRVILYDDAHKKSMAYYIPYLEKLQYVKKEGKNHEVSSNFLIKRDDIENKVIFEMRQEGHSYSFMRMDLVESILRRGAVGVGLKEVEII